ncbi:MAG: hypothetical protein OXN17_07510 [Candidatus Poribacteria bacterium]|nr:hypothetical protein [Candidatus Poribacteria bacterium]MDE0505047.1 hypothetical protein [Candidatus Poribacteria bacterium]
MAEERGYLVLDSRIIADVEGGTLTLGKVGKHPENPLFTEEKPWEPRYDNVYPDVIYDEDEKVYKCWYNPFVVDARVTSTTPERRHPDIIKYNDVKPTDREIGLCYAVSTDGIHWEKPELGLAEFEGGTSNNIVTRRRGVAGVYKDDRDPDPARRYKMFFSASRGAFAAFSPDGLHWDELIPVPGHEGGNRPSALWSPLLGKYVVITRRNSDLGRRQVTQTESSDFVTWRRERSIMEGPTAQLQTHDMIVFPTCGVYIGLVGVMTFPEEASDHGVKQHAELAWSPDTVTWHRIQEGTPFIGHSPAEHERFGEMPYDWGTIFAAAPIFHDDEVRIYYGAGDWHFFEWRNGYLALATLRPDGWAGYEPISVEATAVITTELLELGGETLGLTADVDDGGSVQVEVVDAENARLAASQPIGDTVTGGRVTWSADGGLASLSGQQARLRFRLHKAKLYGFQFG